MATLTNAQTQALAQVVCAVAETIEEAGPIGVPGGVLYAALMAHGCTLEQFESLMRALVRTGRVVKRGHCYHKGG